MRIDCDTCAGRGSHCSGCIVPVLLGTPTLARPREQLTAQPGDRPGRQRGDIDHEVRRAIAVLSAAGLLPPGLHDETPDDLPYFGRESA